MLYIGHKNPDTDSICGALAAAALFGGEAKMASPDLPPEAQLILTKFNFQAPEYIADLNKKKVVLIDFNQKSQGQEGIEAADIEGIIDHHAVGSDIAFNSQPILVRIEPLGSTCSLIAKMAQEKGIEITPQIAGILLAGLVSDTLALRSPTTTPEDEELAQTLAELAGVSDLTELLKEMLKAKSDLTQKTVEEILTLDYKIFDYAQKVGIGVAETATPEDLMARKAELMEGLKIIKERDGLDYIFFAIVDVLNEHSDLLLLEEAEVNLAQKAFGGIPKEGILDIGNRISRKKQIAPAIAEALKL